MRSDANENLAPDKAKAIERIDGGVALIMAWGKMMFSKKEETGVNISFL
jgi:phage terminase large subunit-like protein